MSNEKDRALRHAVRVRAVLRYLGELSLVLGVTALVPTLGAGLFREFHLMLPYGLVAALLFGLGILARRTPARRIRLRPAVTPAIARRPPRPEDIDGSSDGKGATAPEADRARGIAGIDPPSTPQQHDLVPLRHPPARRSGSLHETPPVTGIDPVRRFGRADRARALPQELADGRFQIVIDPPHAGPATSLAAVAYSSPAPGPLPTPGELAPAGRANLRPRRAAHRSDVPRRFIGRSSSTPHLAWPAPIEF